MPTVLSINSHVVEGRVGNSAALLAFAALGIEAYSLPTVVYSQTPGPQGFAGESLPTAQLGAILDRLASDGLARRLDALHIGYVREADAAVRIAQFAATARRRSPELLISLDPALGDDGALYVPAATAEAIKRELVPIAGLLTPNLFELGWLSDRKVWSLPEALAAARTLKAPRVLVTSAPSTATRAATLLSDAGGAHLVETPRFPSSPHGTGDVLAALFLSRLLRQEAPAQALALSVASVYDLIEAANGGPVLPLTEHFAKLAAPASRFAPARL